MHRRRFFMVTGGSLAAAMVPETGATATETAFSDAAPRTYRRVSKSLGTDVSITVCHSAANRAQAALAAAFEELERVEQLMSIYRADSQITRLNRDGILPKPHAYVREVMLYAQQVSRQTGGAFDVTVQPLWDLHRAASAEQRVPTSEEVAGATSRVSWRRVDVQAGWIGFQRPGMAITLNGIAQGFAADCVAATLGRHGVTSALIDTGEVGSIGDKEGTPWRVGIQHPRDPDAFVSLASLAGRCLATSGDYATRFAADFSSHHLLDPRNGRPANHFSSVSVVAPTAMQADAISTAVFVMGWEEGERFLRTLPDVDALLVSKDGKVRMTEGFPAQVG